MAGIPCQPSLPCLSVGRPVQRVRWGCHTPYVSSTVGATPWGHCQHRNMTPGLWLSDQVPPCLPLLASPPSPSGGWRRPQPRWKSWVTVSCLALHLGTPWTGVRSNRRPWPPWSVGPGTSEEFEASWDRPHTPREVPVPFTGLRHRRTYGYKEIPWRGPPPSCP